MEFLYHFIPDHLLHALGWTVVHSLWQGLLAALGLGLYLFYRSKADSRKRYWGSFMAMGVTLVAAVFTFFTVLDAPETGMNFMVGTINASLIEEGPVSATLFADRLNESMPFIVLIWFLGMAVFLLKMMGGLLYVQRLKHRHLSAVPAGWNELLKKLSKQLELTSAVTLSASALVKVPMVVGWLKPMVLVPIGAINQLTTEQVEAILAHELAHIARYDYVLNLLQSFIEIVFYFNPAIWWISANIRTERENCCDDLAVKLCGDPFNYARALVSLQEMHQAAPAFALSFAKGKNQLLARVQRILQQPHKNPNAMERFSVIGLILAATFMLSMQATTNLNLLSDESGENVWTELGFDEFEFEDEPFTETILDTLPGGKIHLQWSDDEGDGELRIEKGEIVFLEIDGEEIPESEYGEHEEVVMELLDAYHEPPSFGEHFIPEPPAPPAPPRFEEPGEAPMAPEAPRPTHPRFAPPAPPAPVAPSPFNRKIVTERDGKNTTIIIEGGLGQGPIEIEVEGGRKGSVIINGEELKNLKDGEGPVVVDELIEPGFHFLGEGDDELIFMKEGEGRVLHFAPQGMEEHILVMPDELDFEALELDEARRKEIEAKKRILMELKVDSELYELERLAELEKLHDLKALNKRVYQKLNEKEMKAMAEEQRVILKEMKAAQQVHRKVQEELRLKQIEQRKELRRQLYRERGAM